MFLNSKFPKKPIDVIVPARTVWYGLLIPNVILIHSLGITKQSAKCVDFFSSIVFFHSKFVFHECEFIREIVDIELYTFWKQQRSFKNNTNRKSYAEWKKKLERKTEKPKRFGHWETWFNVIVKHYESKWIQKNLEPNLKIYAIHLNFIQKLFHQK